ncbi:hypothetical protein KHQ81_00745 [Mycoplasmatota bacterium]|nr:hypothetical protein KHQ81_00745 [Mycoplasmatota bacterium]
MFLDQTGFEEFIKFVPKTLVSLSLFQCKDIKDLSPLEKLNNIEYLNFYWNRKATKLWNMTFTPKLQTLQMVDCNKIIDFSYLKNANIKKLRLMGCNGLSSFTSKLMIDDLSNIFNMKI